MPAIAMQCKCRKCDHQFNAAIKLPMSVSDFCTWCNLLLCPRCAADVERIGLVVDAGVVSGHDISAAAAARPQTPQSRSGPLPIDGQADAASSRTKAKRARPLSEAAITAAIVRLLCRVRGAYVIKTHGGPMQRAGLPDLLVWIPMPRPQVCLAGAFEVKVPGNKPTPLQEHTIHQMRLAGVHVSVVTSVKDVQAWLDRNGIEIKP